MNQNFSLLTGLGWSDFFANQLNETDRAELLFGRVIEVQRELSRVATGAAEWWASPSGRFRGECTLPGDWPVAGDWVGIAPQDAMGDGARAHEAEPGRAILRRRLERRGQFVRLAPGDGETPQVLAANLDAICLVSACNGEMNLRRIERYLTTTAESGARPLIALNKADLLDDESRAAIARAVQACAPGVPVLFTHTLDESGVTPLREFLRPRETIALLGSSGVGKSTLTNELLGRAAQATGEVRAHDNRGRHTTTHRQLFLRPQGGSIIDTPGMRGLELWNSGEDVGSDFDDIESLANQCKFRNCRHNSEPGCAVRAAIGRGDLQATRLASYVKFASPVRVGKR